MCAQVASSFVLYRPVQSRPKQRLTRKQHEAYLAISPIIRTMSVFIPLLTDIDTSNAEYLDAPIYVRNAVV